MHFFLDLPTPIREAGGWAVQAKKRGGGAGEACHSLARDRRQHGPRFLPNGLGLDGQGVADPALKEIESADPLRRAQRGERLSDDLARRIVTGGRDRLPAFGICRAR
jgi:hypothetical protein